MKKVLLVAALTAVVLVPAAAASSSHRVKLSLVPLPKSALGAAARGLTVARGSGVISNTAASNNSITANPTTFAKLGRLTGYDLTYGDRYSGRPGVTEIATGIDKYKTAAGARRGLAFWRKDDAKIGVLGSYGLAVSVRSLKAPKAGKRRFAEGTTFSVPNAAPVALVDEQFTDGRYLLRVEVGAGSLSAGSRLAAKLARKLDHRLRLAEAGHLRGKPVKLPPRLAVGPPAGGPDLATLALTTADLGGQATIVDHAYETPGPPSLSEYQLDMQPAGRFSALTQLLGWFPSVNEATVFGRFTGAAFAYVLGSGLGTGGSGHFTPVDLSTVGDGAFGGIVSVSQTGQPTIYLAIVSLSSGQVEDLVLTSSDSATQPADVVNLAQATANRLNAGLGTH
ncbi:MAG TPA: hypothetical protein VJ716_06660 [Gaiellaceae bacterium]|nr:hypothetical protein [Gaiellaceae bacterium]